jgi:hypothetical protein
MLATRVAAAALAAAAMLANASPAPAQSYLIQGSEQFFRVEWEAGRDRKSRPVVSGYVHNRYGAPAANVRMLVELLDGAGQVIDREVHALGQIVPNDGRLYFELRVRPAASYRVRVAYWDWQRGGV